MTNIIFIKGASYADVKKALLQWIALYEDLDPAFTFMLYEDIAATGVILKADIKLSNEHFAYLVNYLKYPEGIDYKASINAYTEITQENFFPDNLSGNKIMLFIPDSDTEYDNVYWVTTSNQVYKTDMGAKTTKIQSNETYQAWDLATTVFPPSETLHVERRNSKSNQEVEVSEKSEENISGRFKVLFIIMTIVLIIVFLYRKINIELSSTLYLYFLVGITAWFLADHKMLRVVRFFNLAYIIAALLVFYGHFFAPEGPRSRSNLALYSLFPLIFLSVQKPIRLIFKSVFKREPVIEKPMLSFADFFYFLFLLLFSLLGLILMGYVLK